MPLTPDMDIPEDLRRELLDAATKAGVSYAWLLTIYRRGRDVTLGATGTFPFGRLNPDDEGELALAMATDHQQGVIRLQFGKPVAWLALPATHARVLAATLQQRADDLDRRKA